MDKQNHDGFSTESEQAAEQTVKKPLIADKDLFARWLFLFAEQITCGVLALLPSPAGIVQRTAYFLNGYHNENYRLLDWVKDTEWETTYRLVIGVFFVAVAFTAIGLFSDRFKRRYTLIGMLIANVVFTASNLLFFFSFKPAIEAQSYIGIPWKVSWTNTGYVYLVVSAFAILEIVMTLLALRKRRLTEAKKRGGK